MDGSGKLHGGISDQRGFFAQRVAGQRVLQFRDRADVARVQFGHRRKRLAEQRADVRQTFVTAACARSPGWRRSCTTPEITLKYETRPAEGIGDGFENESRHRLGVLHRRARPRLPLRVPFHGPRSAGLGKFSSAKFRIRSLADIVQPGRAQHREDAHAGARPRAGLRAMCSTGQRALVEELFEQRVVALGHHLDQRFVRRSGGVGEIRGDRRLLCPCRRRPACRCTLSCAPGRSRR